MNRSSASRENCSIEAVQAQHTIEQKICKLSKLLNKKHTAHNKRISLTKNNGNYIFLMSMNIIFGDNLKYVNCEETIYWIKRNVLINLYYSYQIDLFFAKCKQIELEI